jgi:pimeloyl-ACP methyl ester carboxylesterase
MRISNPPPECDPGFSPTPAITLAEVPRAVASILSLPMAARKLSRAPRGEGQPVLVIPGFAAADGSTAILRAYLNRLDYDAHGWGLGRNLGAKTIGVHNERLIRRLDRFHARRKRPVALVGWSMGGIMARMIARARPDKVSRVVTLAAPFTGDPFANRAWQVYERMTGHSLAHPVAQAQIAESKLPMPVPATAIHSKSDGVVDWRCCLEPNTGATDNVEVRASHCGMGFDADALHAVAHALSRDVRRRRSAPFGHSRAPHRRSA